MATLEHFNDYRVVKVALKLQNGEPLELDGVARTTTSPQFEVTFLPDQLQAETLNVHEACQVSFDIAGSTKSVKAKIAQVVSDVKLIFEVLESFTYAQKRSYFRVEAELSVSYWLIDDDNSTAKSVNTPVNISGGGMRLPVSEKLQEGAILGLEIVLNMPQPCIVECTAKVVKLYGGGFGGGYQLALSYVDIEQEDQDAIVAYCLAEQRKQLRLKVQVL